MWNAAEGYNIGEIKQTLRLEIVVTVRSNFQVMADKITWCHHMDWKHLNKTHLKSYSKYLLPLKKGESHQGILLP